MQDVRHYGDRWIYSLTHLFLPKQGKASEEPAKQGYMQTVQRIGVDIFVFEVVGYLTQIVRATDVPVIRRRISQPTRGPWSETFPILTQASTIAIPSIVRRT